MSRYTIQLIVIGFALFFSSLKVNAQCAAKDFEKSNILRLSKNFDHKHTFVLDKADATGEISSSFIFNKGTLYMMNVSNYRGEEKNIIVELYDQNGKLVATNYNKTTRRFWPLGYVCKESGVHKIKFKFIDTDRYCGICVLGAK